MNVYKYRQWDNPISEFPYIVQKMNTYCLSCKKDTRNINPNVIKTKNNRKMMLSRCSICNNKKSTFLSKGSGIFDSLVYNTNRNRIKDALLKAFR